MLISEVSKKYDISTDTLRYYEKIGVLPPISRNQSGLREYSKQDCSWIELVQCLRRAGLPIEALVRYRQLTEAGDETFLARRELLYEQKQRLLAKQEQINQTLQLLDYKIDRYDQAIQTGILTWDE
jgi:DNA-binding transcriptional MerR regulator